jgi:hypothetical protein
VDCEFQIEIQFNKHRVERPIDEPLRIYLSKLKTRLIDAINKQDNDNEMVFYLIARLTLIILHWIAPLFLN